ncbi:MAG: hypothetical protein WD059_13470 [Balneolaceae bacterium]
MIKSNLKLIVSSLLMLIVLVQCSTTDADFSLEDPEQLAKSELVTPGNGSENQSTSVELTWKATTGAQHYNIKVSEDPEFESVSVDELTEKKSFKDTLNLQAGKEYFWKIRSLKNGQSGPWSDTWNFTTSTVEKQPITVDLISPVNNGEENAADIYFEWEAALEGRDYHFQVSEDQNFETAIIDSIVENTSLALSDLKGGKQYYWRVSPILNAETGAWSETSVFSTGAEDPSSPAPVSNSAFVSAQNSNFVVDGQVFRYAGTNAYHLPNYEKSDSRVVDEAFDSFQEAGVSVVRTWGFYDGPPQYSGDITLQPRAGEYNEEDLRHFDNMIAKGKEHNVRFVIALTNFWTQLGGICEYNKWAGESTCDVNGGAMSTFINGAEQQRLYKEYISMLLNRVNTVTGVAYKDEPAIFAWEIINEGRNRGEHPTEIRDWYQDIARYIKSIDTNHMVATGEEGFDDGAPAEYSSDQYSNNYVLRAGEGTSYVLNTAIPEIDFGGAHWYPSEWGYEISEWGANPEADLNLLKAQQAWMGDHANIAESHGKPFVMGEYGFPGWGDSRVEAVYEDFWSYAEEINLDGSLIWQFTADFTKCSEYGGNICWPGGRQDQKLYTGFVDHLNRMAASTN